MKRPRQGWGFYLFSLRIPAEEVAECCRGIDEFSHFVFSPGKTLSFMFLIRKKENSHELNIWV